MYPHLLDRFIKYTKINTRSDEKSDTIPSTPEQVEFAKVLMADLEAMGMKDVEYNEANGYVTATLPANTDKDIPTIGLIAHMDTADFNSIGINPQIHENYDGEAIVLNEEQNIVLSPADFPNLKNYIGQTLITTDGTTLLGSDDKSGIVEIMSACEYLIENPEITHGRVRVAFGPDEEIGTGADHFDVEHFDADFAYTVDGGPVGEIQYESFNAASGRVFIQGKNVHPGSAKDQMVNALTLAIQFENALPDDEVPEHTDGLQGFYHLMELEGTVDQAYMNYIIRDHDRDNFEARKENFKRIAKEINDEYGEERVKLEVYDQYYNMGEVIEKDRRSVDLAIEAMNNLGIEPNTEPIRGGTDGCKISFMGLPTPNLFAGGENFHGRYEYVSLQAMERATDTILEILRLASK